NLETRMGTLVIDSNRRDYSLRIDGEAQRGIGPYTLQPGPHRMTIEAHCFEPKEPQPQLVDIKSGETTKVLAEWKPEPPSICVIQPLLGDGRTNIAGIEATVSIDGQSTAPYDGATAYSVPCGATTITAAQYGYSSATLAVGGSEWKDCIRGLPWHPVLEEDQ